MDVTPRQSQAQRQLHVMHVVLSLDSGGLEHVVLHLIREGKRLGQKTTVMCVERPGTLANEAESLGARVLCAHKPSGIDLKTIGIIERMLRDAKPDVVHAHQIGALFYAGPAARRCRIPVVVHTEHGKHYEGQRRKRWMAWWSARYAQRFFCVSHDIANAVVAHGIVPPEKVGVVENGIDLTRYGRPSDTKRLRSSLGIPEKAPIIGTVGRLAAVKRQDVLLRAFAKMKVTSQGAAHLVLVGGGVMEGDLRSLAAALGIEARVHFVGQQSDPVPYLHAMDIFALTSESEGMPLSVLEAWAAGVPVVTSRVGGLPELIDAGRTGMFFENGDTEALARVLMELLGDDQQRRALCASGGDMARRRYSAEVMADKYREHYLQLIKRDVNNFHSAKAIAANISPAVR